MEKQTLRLPLNNDKIKLSVRRSEEHGSMGTFPWRGGLILPRQICEWATDQEYFPSVVREGKALMGRVVRFESLFIGNRVLELGAVAARLPSMTHRRINNSRGCQTYLFIPKASTKS